MPFGRPFIKRFALCYRTVVLTLCDVSVLWPDGWMDQDESWHGGKPRPPPHCVRWGPSCPPQKRSTGRGAQPQFSAHVRCGQTAGWIEMPVGTEVGLGPGDTVLDWDPAPPKRGTAPNFRPMSVATKRLDGLRCHLVWR